MVQRSMIFGPRKARVQPLVALQWCGAPKKERRLTGAGAPPTMAP
jgi:hypothetical protein